MKFKASQSSLLRLRCDLLVNSRGEIFSQKLTPFFLNVKAALTRIRMAKARNAHPRMHNASNALVLYRERSRQSAPGSKRRRWTIKPPDAKH
jgi:hypothetical protein